MKGKVRYSIVWPESGGRNSRKEAGEEGEFHPLDPALYARLKELRNNLSREHRLPPYGVFSNRTLEALARIRPTTVEAAMTVKGVGAVKAERFLAPFLDLFRERG